MALNAPLNDRQIEVLRWISDGCPDGRWTDLTFKTTANALAWRRLVTVSKHGGVWSAAILPAGEHYLANSEYPTGHWANRRRGQHVDLDTPLRPAAIAHQPVVPLPKGDMSPRPKKPTPPDGLTPTRKLVKDIVDAGGILEIDTTDDKTSYRGLVGIINRRGMAPDGQEVILIEVRYDRVVLRLSSVSDWKTEPPADVIAAERIGRWHTAVAALRDEKRLDPIDKELRGRAFRLLHTLAREAEARGHAVRVCRLSYRGYPQENSRLTGDLIFTVGDIDCSVAMSQPTDRVDHIPTRQELEREKRYSWDRPPRYDYVRSDMWVARVKRQDEAPVPGLGAGASASPWSGCR